MQHLRETERELRADNSYMRRENQKIHQELVTSGGQYLCVLRSIESEKAVLDAPMAQFQRAEQVYEDIHKDIKDTLKHLQAQLHELRDEGTIILLSTPASTASPREKDAPRTESLPPQLPVSFAPLVPPVDTPISFSVSLGGGCFVARTMYLNGCHMTTQNKIECDFKSTNLTTMLPRREGNARSNDKEGAEDNNGGTGSQVAETEIFRCYTCTKVLSAHLIGKWCNSFWPEKSAAQCYSHDGGTHSNWSETAHRVILEPATVDDLSEVAHCYVCAGICNPSVLFIMAIVAMRRVP